VLPRAWKLSAQNMLWRASWEYGSIGRPVRVVRCCCCCCCSGVGGTRVEVVDIVDIASYSWWWGDIVVVYVCWMSEGRLMPCCLCRGEDLNCCLMILFRWIQRCRLVYSASDTWRLHVYIYVFLNLVR
jgi:hypothetical protein